MASARNGNTIYIDDTTSFPIVGLRVSHIIVSAVADNAAVRFDDPVTNDKKIIIRLASANTTQELRFADQPMLFPNGIVAGAIDNCAVTLITSTPGG